MSAAIRKLEALLSRVQTRRAEPRVHVAAASEAVRPQHVEPLHLKPEMMRVPPPSSSPFASEPAARELPQPEVGERVSRPLPTTPLENAMGQLAQPAPQHVSPTPVVQRPQFKAPPAADDDLVLDDFDDGPPTIRPPEPFHTPARPVAKAEPPKLEARVEIAKGVEEDKPTRVAPAIPEAFERAEPIKPTRIATAEPVAASPVTTVSAARAFVPKTFAQLVERSLALRPRR
jgi:hypothetical protein